MTLNSYRDSDTHQLLESLTPCERLIYEQAKRKPDEPFCFLDFTHKYAHGTIRNAFSALRKKGLIQLYCRSGPAFYVLSGVPRRSIKKVTVPHEVGGNGVREIRLDLGSFLDSLELEDVCRVHNVTLVFDASYLYRLFMKGNIGCLVSGSFDISLGPFVWSRGRILKVFLHHGGRVTCFLACSSCPVEVSLDSLVGLVSFLGGVRIQILETAVKVDSAFDGSSVPDVPNWIVSQWHYGRDGACEISGPAFHVSFTTWFGELARIYIRRTGRSLKPRLEICEKPRKTLQVAFAEKIESTFSVSGTVNKVSN